MKIRIKKENIIDRLGFMETIISEKSPKEILSHILFEVEGNVLNLSVTNLETALKCTITAEIIQPGNISILANKFSDIVRNLPKESEITISSDSNNKIIITANKLKTETQGFSKDDFPTLQTPDFSAQLSIPQPLLKELLKKTMFATLRNDDNKPFLNGIFLNIKGEKISAVGSDGFRLSYITRSLNISHPEEISVIIPNRTVVELFKVLNFSSGEVVIAISKKQILFKMDDIIFLSRLIEEKFPKFDQVIPKESNHTISLNIADLEIGLKLVRTTIDEKNPRVNFEFSNNQLELKSMSDIGTTEYSIPIEFSGEPLSIPFKIDYLVEFLKSVESEQINMKIINVKSQVLFETPDDSEYLYITMPMRLS